MKHDLQTDIYRHESASTWLRVVFEERQERNRSYSLRSFAASFGISHSSLVRLFQGKTTLSPENIDRVVQVLELNATQARYFRLIAADQVDVRVLDQLKIQAQTQKLEIDSVARVLNLNAASLLQMIEVGDRIPFTVSAAAKKLSLSKSDVLYLIEHLKHLKLISGSGNDLKCTQERILLETDEAKAALIRYYQSGLTRAAESLLQDQPKERAIGTEILAFDEQDLPEAEKIIDEALNRLVALSQKSKNPQNVYQCINMIYRLTKKEEDSCA